MDPNSILKLVREQRKCISDSFKHTQIPKYTKNDDIQIQSHHIDLEKYIQLTKSQNTTTNNTLMQPPSSNFYLHLQQQQQQQREREREDIINISRSASVKSVTSDSGLGSSSPLSDCSDYTSSLNNNNTQLQQASNNLVNESIKLIQQNGLSRKRKSCTNIYDEIVNKYQAQQTDNITKNKSLRTQKSSSPHDNNTFYTPNYSFIQQQQQQTQLNEYLLYQQQQQQQQQQAYSLAMFNQAIALQQQQQQFQPVGHAFKPPQPKISYENTQKLANESTEAYINKFLMLSLGKQQQNQQQAEMTQSSQNFNAEFVLQLKKLMNENTNEDNSALVKQISMLIDSTLTQQQQQQQQKLQQTNTQVSLTQTPLVASNESIELKQTDIPVTISKKMLPIISSRIHDWIEKSIEFAFKMSTKYNINSDIINDLLIKAWPRLLLINMIENSFDFCVTKDHQSALHAAQQFIKTTAQTTTTTQDLLTNQTYLLKIAQKLPKEKDVTQLNNLISKGYNMNLNVDEYNELREIVLFRESTDEICAKALLNAQKRLKQLIEQNHINNKQLFSKLLLFLPSIYNVKTEIINNLFCKNLKNSKDVYDLILTKSKLIKQQQLQQHILLA